MDLASPATALSPAIKNLLCFVGMGGESLEHPKRDTPKVEKESETRVTNRYCCDESGCNTGNSSFVSSHGELDLDRIAALFPASDNTAEYFCETVQVLAPVFAECQCVLSGLGHEQVESVLMPRLQWTQSQEIFRECLTLLAEQPDDNARNILVVLLLTAVLERALGNVYLLEGRQCPSMLKDLLVTEELNSILGQSVMQTLRTVIGPPTSLNLRNVAWHGFLGDQELSRRYCCFLAMLSASMGDVLTRKGVATVPHRPFVVWGPAVKARLRTALQISESMEAVPDLHEVKTVLTESGVLQAQTQHQWELTLSLFTQGSYGFCLALLLPLMEHVLRRIFATVNRCPHRVLTAESSALYTTFNEMLEPSLPDGSPNQLPEFLTTPCMDLLHDLLFYPEGLRVRDHLSHGEVEFGAVDQTVVLPFLHVVVFLALRLHPQPSLSTNRDCKVMEGRVQCYRSAFHPVAILQHKFAGLLSHVENTETLPLGSVHSALLGDSRERQQQGVDNALWTRTLDAATPLWQCQSLPSVGLHSSRQRSMGHSLQLGELQRIALQHIPTLFRWQNEEQGEGKVVMKESECVGLLLRITEECSTAVQQVQQTLQQRHQQLQARQLRSRQRDNLKKLLACVPCLQVLVSVVSAVIGWTIQQLQNFAPLVTSHCKMLQRFLKGTLQVCENLRTLTSQDKNKWTESVDLLLTWIPTCQQFLLRWNQHSG